MKTRGRSVAIHSRVVQLCRFGWHRTSSFIRLVASRGIVKTLKPYVHVLRSTGQTSPEAVAFDREWQVETAGHIHPLRLRVNSRNDVHASQYQTAVPELCLAQIIALNISIRGVHFYRFGLGERSGSTVGSPFPLQTGKRRRVLSRASSDFERQPKEVRGTVGVSAYRSVMHGQGGLPVSARKGSPFSLQPF
jgi:hypothetical protein